MRFIVLAVAIGTGIGAVIVGALVLMDEVDKRTR